MTKDVESGDAGDHGENDNNNQAPSTVTASYDLFVPVRKRFNLDSHRLSEAIRQLGLDVDIPTTVPWSRLNVDYVPVRVKTNKGVVNTGVTLSIPEEWLEHSKKKPDGDDNQNAWLPGAIGDFTIYAKNAPVPADENEIPLAWFFATAIADLGQGAVVDPQEDGKPISRAALLKTLQEEKENFDPQHQAWQVYPYELFLGAEQGQLETVRIELDNGAVVNARDSMGNTALHLAARGGHKVVVNELIKRGADVTAVNRYGASVVDSAMKSNDPDIMKTLISSRAPCRDIAFRMIQSDDQDGLERLVAAGCSVESATPKGFTLLMVAAYEGKTTLVRWLVDQKANIEAETVEGVTPLMVAAAEGHEDVVTLLLSKGANANHRDKLGATPLNHSAESPTPVRITELLKRAGAREQ